eukprot:Nitzschia sp. Nitz4//scaffold91_size79674//34775//35812//NITZ4_005367-RA/size79674-processed-gene-0.93-mRNA-1//1//CDS//3329560100//5623//frame0
MVYHCTANSPTSLMEDDPIASAILDEDVQRLRDALDSTPTSLNCSLDYKVPGTTKTPLMLAMGRTSKHTKMVQLLLSYRQDPSCPDESTGQRYIIPLERGEMVHGMSPLLAACYFENLELASVLLDCGANVNASSADGRTPLIQMAKIGNVSLIDLLLNRGANPLAYDEQAKNALMYACSEHQLEAAKLLLRRCPKLVNAYKVDTPLWHASAAGHADIVQVLLENGASLEYRQDSTIYSTTPLMEACEWGHLEVVKLLLYYGADPRIVTGRKAWRLASQAGYHEVASCVTAWSQRLKNIDRWIEQGDLVLPNLVPHVLDKAGRRHDLIYQLLLKRCDMFLAAACE